MLSGGMNGDLTTLRYCVDWWNARRSDHREVLCLLSGGMHGDLTTKRYCVDWWNAR